MTTDDPEATAPPASGDRLAGVVSQLLNTATNAGTAYLAALLLGPTDFGTFAVAFAVVTIIAASARGLLGLTILTALPTAGSRRQALARSALGLSVVVGVGAAALAGVGSAWIAGIGGFALWLLPAVVHDACRFVAFAQQHQRRALAIDLVWAAAQGAALLVVIGTGTLTANGIAATWGVGATAGVVAFWLIDPARPAHPRAWWEATRRSAGWYVGGTLLGQIEFYATTLVVAVLLTAVESGEVRATQLIVAQPPLALLGALLAQSTPRAAIAFHTRDDRTLAAVLRSNVLLALPVVALTVVLAAVSSVLLPVLLPDFDGLSSLVAPTAAIAVGAALSVPGAVALRGMMRIDVEVLVLTVRTVATLVALPIAFGTGSVEAGLWTAAALQLVGAVVLALTARRIDRRAA